MTDLTKMAHNQLFGNPNAGVSDALTDMYNDIPEDTPRRCPACYQKALRLYKQEPGPDVCRECLRIVELLDDAYDATLNTECKQLIRQAVRVIMERRTR